MAKKNLKPEYMRQKLKSRAAIAAWLLDAADHHGDQHQGDYKNWIFCFDGNNHRADISFNNLLSIFQDEQGGSSTDPIWVEACRRYYAEEFCGWDPEDEEALEEFDFDSTDEVKDYRLYEWGVERAVEMFTGRRVDKDGGKPDDDAWNTVWDGTEVDVRFGFVDTGSCDDQLCLKKFEDHLCTEEDLGVWLKAMTGDADAIAELAENDSKPEDFNFKTLQRLYEYVQFLNHFFEKDGFYKEIEHDAAWSLFANLCDALPNPTAEAAQQSWLAKCKAENEKQRKKDLVAFTKSLQRGHRQTGERGKPGGDNDNSSGRWKPRRRLDIDT